MDKNNDSTYKKLYFSILEGVFNKKAEEVIEIDLNGTGNSICRSFIICHGESNTQVRAIAESVEEKVKEVANIKAWHKEGVENSQWILLDYSDIIVHIFQQSYRRYYNLEELWADGKIHEIEDEGNFLKQLKEDGRK